MLNVLLLAPGPARRRLPADLSAVAQACDSLAPKSFIVVGEARGLDGLSVAAQIIRETPLATRGEACSALLAQSWIDNPDELLIVSGEALANVDPVELVERCRQRQLAAGLATFRSDRPAQAYVRVDRSGLVVEASESRPISRRAAAGLYWFAQGSDFVRAVQSMIRKDPNKPGRFDLCPALNELVLAQKRIGVLSLDQAFSAPGR